MRTIFIAFFIILSGSNLTGQILKGTIKTVTGAPLPYATVYIRELQQGTISNTKGVYEIHLPDGKYTVIYQSMGYAPEIRTVTLSRNSIEINISLQVQYYEIPEVRVTASGEDPAYGIMRKVIGLAPYYLNQVSNYKAEIYLKGNLKINKIPKILQKTIKMEAKNESGASANSNTMKEGETYLMESVNEVEFNAPDKYIQHVLSYQSTFPDEGSGASPMDFIQGSFYQPVIGAMFVSPLSPEAFSNYKFRYLGSTSQGNFIVNKIEVIPKRKSQQLFDGTIFIIEDLWCLHSVNLNNDNLAGKIKVQELFIPVQEGIWMPVSYKFEMEISFFGVKADAGYGSSIKYSVVSPNKTLKKPENMAVFSTVKVPSGEKQADTAKTKNRKQIEKILSKGELTNRDMMKLSTLMEKESDASRSDSSRKSLEVKETVTHIIEKDAAKKDSSYWADVRPIPLSDVEYKSLRTSDSLKAKLNLRKDKADTSKTIRKQQSLFQKRFREIASGHTWSDSTGFSFYNHGLLRLASLSFNTVDGFVYGTDFRVSKTWKNKTILNFSPTIAYAFSRHQLMWRLSTSYRFDRMKQRSVYLRAGMTSKDINNTGGIDPFLNSITSLFFKSNYLKLYETNYVTTGFRTEIKNGLYFDLNGSYENRKILSNTTNFSFIKSKKDYDDNVPVNDYLNTVEGISLRQSEKHADLTAVVTYTPQQRYRISNNRKIPLGSDWPTFLLTIRHGMNQLADPGSVWRSFDMILFEASKKKVTGPFGEFYWKIRSGGYLNKKNISFFDFFHFNTSQLPVILNESPDAFMLPRYYSLSTPEFFTEGHTRLTSPCLLLKRLPGLSNTLIRENLSASLLWSDYHKCYTEIGYSLSEIFLMGEIGVYAGFDNTSFKSIGAKIILKIN